MEEQDKRLKDQQGNEVEIVKPKQKTSQQVAEERVVDSALDPMTGKEVSLGKIMMSDADKSPIEKENLSVQKPDLVADAGLEGEYERSSKIDFSKHPELLTDWLYYNRGFENKIHPFHRKKAPKLPDRGNEAVDQGYAQYNRSYRESFNKNYKYGKIDATRHQLVGGWMEKGWNAEKAEADIKSEENYSLHFNRKQPRPKTRHGVNYSQMLENNIRDQYRLDRNPLSVIGKRESVAPYVKEAYKDYIVEEVHKVGSINHAAGRYTAGFDRLNFVKKARANDEKTYEYNIAERDNVDEDAVYYNYRNKATTKDLIGKNEKQADQKRDMKPQRSNEQIGSKTQM